MKNLFKALAKFQDEVPVIHEETQGYNYTYANLGQILKVIKPILKDNSLGFTQLLDGISIRTMIFHTESGEFIESVSDIPTDVEMKGMNKFQVMGSAITYFRRYSLSCALGLITDKDIDAKGDEIVEAKSQVKEGTVKKKLSDANYKKALESDVKGISATLEKMDCTDVQRKTLEYKLNELITKG